MSPLRARCSDSHPTLRERLAEHPFVELGQEPSEAPIEFEQGHWLRSVWVGKTDRLHGLVELCDNNPMVCADSFSVPDPASTLALIALGPLVRAGILLEPPQVLASFDADEEQVSAFLHSEGWDHGLSLHCQEARQSVLALNALALVRIEESPDEIDALYEEAFGRSFFVRRVEDGAWDVPLVAGQCHAAYRLRLTEGAPHSLLTIQTMADRDGKAGAGQIVHAMNVMAGFEESLGLA